MAETLHAAVAPYVVLYTEGLGGAADSDAEHIALLEACRRADVDAACRQLKAHLDGAATALLAFFACQREQ